MSVATFKVVLNRVVSFCLVIYTLVYLLSCATSYISPLAFKGFTLLALVFPLLFFGMLLLIFICFFIKRKLAYILLFLTFLGYKNIFSTIGIHFFRKEFSIQKPAETIRLMSWNVNDFIDCWKSHDNKYSYRRTMLKTIKQFNPDILCFQDYLDFEENKGVYSNTKFIRDTLHYPYMYLSNDYNRTNKVWPSKYGTIIFSRFPIIDSGRVAYNTKHNPEHIMYATIQCNNKKVRIYNTHLHSMFLHKFGRDSLQDYGFVEDDTAVIFNGSTIEKLMYFDSVHVHQARVVKDQLNKCDLPYIFCSDLNSVPSSYVYQTIASGLDDAFLQFGRGFGETYPGISKMLRIDVILMNNQIKVKQFSSPRVYYASDHYPNITDFEIR